MFFEFVAYFQNPVNPNNEKFLEAFVKVHKEKNPELNSTNIIFYSVREN